MKSMTLRDRIFSAIGSSKYASLVSKDKFDRDLYAEIADLLTEILPFIESNENIIDDTTVAIYAEGFNHKLDAMKLYRDLHRTFVEKEGNYIPTPSMRETKIKIESIVDAPLLFAQFEKNDKTKIFDIMNRMEYCGIRCRCSDPNLDNEYKSGNASLFIRGLRGLDINAGKIAKFVKVRVELIDPLFNRSPQDNCYIREISGRPDGVYRFLQGLEDLGVKWQINRNI